MENGKWEMEKTTRRGDWVFTVWLADRHITRSMVDGECQGATGKGKAVLQEPKPDDA
jgi:hypothetical protein